MQTIYKYSINSEILMPVGARILSVGHQRGVLTLWALVNPDPDAEVESRAFRVVGTGWRSSDATGKFLGTVQVDELVWHIFEELLH